MSIIETKGNLKSLPVDHFVISSSEVAKYLENQLGFPFDCDFELLDNRSEWEKPLNTDKCFVLMRAVFRPEDICVKAVAGDYVDTVLKETGSGMMFKDTVKNTLKEFMFPDNIRNIQNMPEKLQALAQQGLCGPKLENLIRRPGLFFDQVNNRFGVYLRPEKIIVDMCKNPATNKLDGVIGFGYVSDASKNAAAISWGVNLYRNMISAPSGGITIDAVFNGMKA